MSSSELKPANTKLKSKKKHQLTDQSKAYNFTHQNPQKIQKEPPKIAEIKSLSHQHQSKSTQ
jgi:hypothetical protein